MSTVRIDGRAPDALRPVTIERNFTRYAPGSVLVSFGGTRVICTAMADERPPAWLKDSGKGWVTAEYGMLPGSSKDRIHRDSVKKGRALEISRLIGRSLRAVVDLRAIGECQITLDCDVIQADGGTRTAAITGAFVALHDALSRAVSQGFLKAVPIITPCAAVSIGIVDGVPMLDLCYEEDVRASVDLNLIMDGAGRIIEVQGTAEHEPFSRDRLNELLDLGEKGIRELIAAQKEALGLV